MAPTHLSQVDLAELRAAKQVSEAIDLQIEADRQRMVEEQDDPRLLVLGSGDSGKTTLLKQLRIFYASGFNEKEIDQFHQQILVNVIQSMTAYLRLCDRHGLEIKHIQEKKHFLSYSHAGRTHIPRDVASCIAFLWQEPSIQNLVPFCTRYHIQDTAPYFLSRISEIAQPEYRPTNQDILNIRTPTTAVSETVFKIGIHRYRFYDVGGQRGLRKQWASFFDNCHAILFVTSLSSFDQTLIEEKEPVNRLQDAIELFAGIVNNDILAKADIMLFLNKKDVFEEKLKRVRLSDYLPKYAGPNDPDNTARYIASLFKAQRKDPNRQILVHRTCCTDVRSMEVIVARLIEGLTRAALVRIGAL